MFHVLSFCYLTNRSILRRPENVLHIYQMKCVFSLASYKKLFSLLFSPPRKRLLHQRQSLNPGSTKLELLFRYPQDYVRYPASIKGPKFSIVRLFAGSVDHYFHGFPRESGMWCYSRTSSNIWPSIICQTILASVPKTDPFRLRFRHLFIVVFRLFWRYSIWHRGDPHYIMII